MFFINLTIDRPFMIKIGTEKRQGMSFMKWRLKTLRDLWPWGAKTAPSPLADLRRIETWSFAPDKQDMGGYYGGMPARLVAYPVKNNVWHHAGDCDGFQLHYETFHQRAHDRHGPVWQPIGHSIRLLTASETYDLLKSCETLTGDGKPDNVNHPGRLKDALGDTYEKTGFSELDKDLFSELINSLFQQELSPACQIVMADTPAKLETVPAPYLIRNFTL